MPLLLLLPLLILAIMALWAVLLPISLIQRYRLGRKRRRVIAWANSLNAWLLLVSLALERSPFLDLLSQLLLKGRTRLATLKLATFSSLASAFMNNTAVVGALLGTITNAILVLFEKAVLKRWM